jgi:hypothetical protein
VNVEIIRKKKSKKTLPRFLSPILLGHLKNEKTGKSSKIQNTSWRQMESI